MAFLFPGLHCNILVWGETYVLYVVYKSLEDSFVLASTGVWGDYHTIGPKRYNKYHVKLVHPCVSEEGEKRDLLARHTKQTTETDKNSAKHMSPTRCPMIRNAMRVT